MLEILFELTGDNCCTIFSWQRVF